MKDVFFNALDVRDVLLNVEDVQDVRDVRDVPIGAKTHVSIFATAIAPMAVKTRVKIMAFINLFGR